MLGFTNLKEDDIRIDLLDGKKIHGFLRGSLTDGSPVLVIMHGRVGSPNEEPYFLAARYLYEQGITTLRLAMYDFGAEYRDLLDCTLDTHVADFETVVIWLHDQGVEKVFAAGHSYGGITIIGSKAQLDGAVLWDPSHGLAWQDPEFDDPEFRPAEFGDIRLVTSGPGVLGSAAQEEYDASLGDNTEWVKGKTYPMKFILASAGPLAKYAKKYYDAAEGPKALVEMADAHHQLLDSDSVMERLFEETASWVRKHA